MHKFQRKKAQNNPKVYVKLKIFGNSIITFYSFISPQLYMDPYRLSALKNLEKEQNWLSSLLKWPLNRFRVGFLLFFSEIKCTLRASQVLVGVLNYLKCRLWFRMKVTSGWNTRHSIAKTKSTKLNSTRPIFLKSNLYLFFYIFCILDINLFNFFLNL